MDETGFDRMLGMAGPDLARDLVAQFGCDLADAAAQLFAALARGDMAGVRAAAHVLMALAGTAGQSALYVSAQGVHAAAVAQDASGAAAYEPELATGIDAMHAMLDRRACSPEAAR